jgi:hypothetical protein
MTQKQQRHRWGPKQRFPLARKSERECRNGCGIVEVSRRESEGDRDIYWTEYWRGLEKVSVGKVPICEPVGADA